MRLMSLTLSAAALLAGLGIAAAQQTQVPAPAWQPQDLAKPMQGGKEEPSSHIPTAAPPTGVFVDGKLSVPGAPKDSQTEPAKFSERNAKLDLLPLVPGQPQRK